MSKTRPVYDGTKCWYCGINFNNKFDRGRKKHPVLGKMCRFCYQEIEVAIREGRTWCTQTSVAECNSCFEHPKFGFICMRRTLYEKVYESSTLRKKQKQAKVKEHITV